MSPVVFRYNGFRLQFYANEGNPREPSHVHAIKDGDDAKFWLWPEVRLAYNDGHDERSIRALAKVIEARRAEIEVAWNDFFSKADGRPVRPR